MGGEAEDAGLSHCTDTGAALISTSEICTLQCWPFMGYIYQLERCLLVFFVGIFSGLLSSSPELIVACEPNGVLDVGDGVHKW